MRILALLSLAAVTTLAQNVEPVSWSMASSTAAPGGKVLLKLTAKLGEGWHLYSPTTPKGGPIPTSITLADSPVIESYKLFEPKPDRKADAAFGIDTETFEGDVVFVLEAVLKKDAAVGQSELTANVRYQACNARECRPPKKKAATAKLDVVIGAAAAGALPADLIEVPLAAKVVADAPVKKTVAKEEDLLPFLLTALGFGLASIFTPCVFPMIPITMSYFLKRDSGSRSDGLIQAAIFCIGIVVLFCLLGFAATAIAGPFGVVQLSSSVWVNAFISILFFVFGLSLLGAFEITLPSGLLTKLDSASRQGGTLGTLLMGLTFSLTSFACVGPFVGTLLAGSIQAKGARPMLGMMFFAIGLAAPFFLLAVFPGYLKKLPRSGGWLARVKVVMGFIIVAAMFKYLSNIDLVMHWGFLTRERFLAAWFVLIVLAGLYLLGFLRLEGIKADDHLGVGRLLTASAFLIFAFSLLPGMLGARLGELDAYVPPSTEPAARSSNEGGLVWMTNQYEEALAKAKAENKLVLVNFTGVTCTNCHWMRQNMFPKAEIQLALKDFVMVELFTDGTGAIDEKNQKLEESMFQTVSLPFYAILTPDGKKVAEFSGYTKNVQEFVAFLKTSPSNT